MQTEHLGPEASKRAAQLLGQGQVVAFPTDTVYGLGALAQDPQAVEAVYTIKGRPRHKALIVLIHDLAQLRELTASLHPIEEALIDRFWPGPLTIVFEADPSASPSQVRAGQSTVAIRQPKYPPVQALLAQVGQPLVAPSANFSQAPTPHSSQEVEASFEGEIAAILYPDPSQAMTDQESTLVQVQSQSGQPVIQVLRPGAVSVEDLQSLGYPVQLPPVGRI